MPQVEACSDHLDVQFQMDRMGPADVNVPQVARRLLAQGKALLAAIVGTELRARLYRELYGIRVAVSG